MTIAHTDEELAFHEAGHSVIRILLGDKFNCQHPRQPGSNDRKKAEVAAASVIQDTDGLLETEWQRVLDTLQRPATWRQVEAVARLLVREQTVDVATVHRVIDDLPA